MKKERAVLSTFSIDPAGNIAYTVNPNKLWDDRVVSVLGTMAGTRLHRPTFGLESRRLPFDTREEVADSVRQAIADAFTVWLPYLTLLSTEVGMEDSNQVVTVRYALPNLDVVTTEVDAGLLGLNGPNPPTEDLS